MLSPAVGCFDEPACQPPPPNILLRFRWNYPHTWDSGVLMRSHQGGAGVTALTFSDVCGEFLKRQCSYTSLVMIVVVRGDGDSRFRGCVLDVRPVRTIRSGHRGHSSIQLGAADLAVHDRVLC